MIDFLSMTPALAIGWIVARLLAPLGWLFEIPIGAGIGIAISSAIFFLLTWAGVASRVTVLSIEAILIAIGGSILFRLKPPREISPRTVAPSWIWALRVAAVIAIGITIMDFSQSTTANPDGGYDAAAIWNLRARFLAGGAPSWHYAVSDETGTNHPGYPLLLSGFIARTWIVLGDTPSSTPAVVGGVFSLAVVAVLIAAIWSIAGETLAWLALLVLAASEGFISQTAVQYADVPLSFYVLASVAVLAIAATRAWPPMMVAMAGLLASCAAWTKNEGLPFVVFVLAVVLWRAFRSAKWFVAGATPLLIVTFAFKLLLVHGNEAMFPSSAGQAMKMIVDGSRWAQIIASFGRNFWDMGFPWAHPFLLLAIAAYACGFSKNSRSRLWIFAAPLGLLAADFGIYLITMSGLTWHLSTSNNRVIAQVWPALLFGFFLLLNPPKTESAPVKKAHKSSSK